MGGASSWYAMLAITGFMTAVWSMGKFSAQIGISSIVLEIAVGIVLGPQVANLIPTEVSDCFERLTVNCDQHKFLHKTALKGYKYCDVQAYLDEGKYVREGEDWTSGFWGNVSHGMLVIDGDKGGTYCLDPSKPDCASRRLLDSESEAVVDKFDALVDDELREGSPKTYLGIPRRLASDRKGQTEYDDYSKCITESCKLDENLECATVPDVFTLLGHTGVAMMIFESGLHFDFEQAKTVAPWASAVAILGTFLPLGTGAALSVAYGFDFFPDALSAGVSLAPTSVGIALKLLHESRALQTFFGQAVMTAAFVDDVLSLVLFSILFNIGPNMDFWTFFPILCGIIFMGFAIVAAVKVWPSIIKFVYSKIPEVKPHAKVTTHDEVLWFMMFFVLAVYGQITHMCATHLWGCFIGGMSFALNHHSHHVWVKQVKRFTCWFIRLFFACTLAWAIPVNKLFSPEAFWKGSLMGIGPCILAKVLSGPFMGSARWVIGWAMVGRAEFAYFIAILAKSVNFMDEKLFAILVWALLYATVFAPLVFRKVLERYMATMEASEEPDSPSAIGKQVSKSSVRSNNSIRSSGIASIFSLGSQVNTRHHSGHLPDLEGEELEEREEEMKQNYKVFQVTIEKQARRIKELLKDVEEKDKASTTLVEKDAEIERLKERLAFAIKTGSNGEFAESI